ncbi:LuxR family transcriptional regulator [Gordonibacter sp.]|uniref:LuxR family transcriptional regulator n=2 Tax=Gordonibacter sp. TaxID=1968902 RepID=UPI002FC89347
MGNGMKNRVIVCLGVSLSLLIGTFALWGGLPLSSLTGLQLPAILQYWSVPTLFAVGLSLLSALLKKTRPTPAFLTGAGIASGVLTLSGYSLLLLLGSSEGTAPAVVLAAAVMVGLGFGLVLLLWQCHLSQFSEEAATKILLLSLAASSTCYLVLSFALREQTAIAFPILVIALVVLGIVYTRLPVQRKEDMSRLSHEPGNAKRILAELRDPLLCVGAISFAVALTRAIALDGIDNAEIANITASLGVIVVAAPLYALWFGFKKTRTPFGKLSILGLYRIFFPLIATSLLALSVFGNAWGLAVTTLSYAAFSITSTLIASTSISIARQHRVWSPYVYGVFAGSLYLIFAVATTVAPLVYYPQNFGAATLTVIVLVVLYILAMSNAAVQNRKRKGDSAINTPVAQPVPEPLIVDEVTQRCAVLAEQHKLTKREKDVFLLLAKGRDVPSIAKQLFISENTVRSHSKNVYRKLNVHSKQELLDLLEKNAPQQGGPSSRR